MFVSDFFLYFFLFDETTFDVCRARIFGRQRRPKGDFVIACVRFVRIGTFHVWIFGSLYWIIHLFERDEIEQMR